MAGRGARRHILPASKVRPNTKFEEVEEIARIRKLFPDARERMDAEQFRKLKIRKGEQWLQLEGELRLHSLCPSVCTRHCA